MAPSGAGQLNEEFGRQTCDEMLRCLHGGIMSDLSAP